MTADRSFTCSRENVCPVGRHEPPQYLLAQLPDPVEGPDQELRGEECREFRMLVWCVNSAVLAAPASAVPPAPSPPAPEDPFPFSPPIPDTDDPLPGPEPGPEPPLTPVPEAPEPEATESCEVFGRRRKSECNRKPSGCIFQKKGKRCLRTPSNGGKCTDYRRKTCIRVGAPSRGPAARRGARAFRRRRRRPARTLRKSSSELTGWSLCTR